MNDYMGGGYVAPNGVRWVSEGAYEQSLKLEEAKARVRELEAELAALRFPVAGMSSAQDVVRGEIDVWPTGANGDSISFHVASCSFCDKDRLCLNVSTDYQATDICHACLDKIFAALQVAA